MASAITSNVSNKQLVMQREIRGVSKKPQHQQHSTTTTIPDVSNKQHMMPIAFPGVSKNTRRQQPDVNNNPRRHQKTPASSLPPPILPTIFFSLIEAQSIYTISHESIRSYCYKEK